MTFTREILHSRHGMSHQQIDNFLGENSEGKKQKEKLWLMDRSGQFVWLTDKLKNEGIQFVSTKGPILSYRIYNDSTVRRFGDFDFLIDFEMMDKTLAVLKNLGFRASMYEWPSDNKTLKFKKKLRNQYHIHHRQRQISIDLHWSLFEYPPLNPRLIQNLINLNLEEIEFLDRKFKVLNRETDLLFLVIHGGLHNWRRLKWLVDVHEIVRKNDIDREKFVVMVKQLKARRLVNLCNGILKIYYPGSALLPEMGKPSKFALKLSVKKIHDDSEREYESLGDLLRYSWFILTAFPGIGYKLRVIRTWFLSAQDDGAKRLSFWKSVGSLINPARFLKKRYRVD